jgi:peptidoglycan/LPS O-acetylase OafA/YrhL
MQINTPTASFQTLFFVVIFLALVILTTKKTPKPYEFTPAHTAELKGVAILMVLFCHIGYFLFSDHSFLYPLSVAGGVGVNIFLFLSGFGLTSSALKSRKTILQFYRKRLPTIFLPMWLVLIATLCLDFFIHGRSYGLLTIIHSILGFFPVADIYTSLNSPLWYFTFILFYYLLFPIVFFKKYPLFSAGLVLGLGLGITQFQLPVAADVLKLYKLHVVAFPLGMAFATIVESGGYAKVKDGLAGLLAANHSRLLIRQFVLVTLGFLFCYTCIHSGVGGSLWMEQAVSLLSVAALVIIFLIKKFQSSLLILLGKYSYEIYLIQWPLMYRFDFIYRHTPPYLGTILYLMVFVGIGIGLNRLVKKAV